MLAIYLSDHLAGATAGVELVRRTAAAQRSTARGPDLARLADEIAADREALLTVMRRLGAPVRPHKIAVGWLAEKAGRLKPNGTWVTRSPLSSVVELEGLLLGITGKLALWRTLRSLADRDGRLDAADLDRLIRVAVRQRDEVEAMRDQAAAEVFTQAST
jgi:hypothetical protein